MASDFDLRKELVKLQAEFNEKFNKILDGWAPHLGVSDPFAGYPKRNLIYHITPMANYLENIRLLNIYLDVFDGVRLATVAQGPGLRPLGEVAKQLPSVTLISVRNDRTIRETAAFPLLLDKLNKIADPDSVTFFGHTKGVTRNNPAVNIWTEQLYRKNLENLSRTMQLLEKYPVVGSFKRKGRFLNMPRLSTWHYSGTFFWFRNRDLFAKPNWKNVPKTRYGTEAYLSLLFSEKEAGCIFGDAFGDGYDIKTWNKLGLA